MPSPEKLAEGWPHRVGAPHCVANWAENVTSNVPVTDSLDKVQRTWCVVCEPITGPAPGTTDSIT